MKGNFRGLLVVYYWDARHEANQSFKRAMRCPIMFVSICLEFVKVQNHFPISTEKIINSALEYQRETSCIKNLYHLLDVNLNTYIKITKSVLISSCFRNFPTSAP